MDHLHEFEGKPLKSAEKADLNLSETPKKEGALGEESAKSLAQWMKDSLGDRVGEVRISSRLVDSPAVVVDADKQMSASMRRILKAVRRDDSAPPAERYDLEINPAHPILVRLEAIRQKDEPLAKDVTEQVYDNARVAAGILEDPRAMLGRLNQLLEKVLR